MDATEQGLASAPEPTRRDFLYFATGAMGVVAAGATLIPLIDQMNPDASTLAAGGPVDVDLAKLAPGQNIIVRWRKHPIFILRRPDHFSRFCRVQSSFRFFPILSRRSINSRLTRRTGIARSSLNISRSSASARISAASRRPSRSRARRRRPLIGWVAISVPVMARNTISRDGSIKAFRHPSTCLCRPITSSATRFFGSAKIPRR